MSVVLKDTNTVPLFSKTLASVGYKKLRGLQRAGLVLGTSTGPCIPTTISRHWTGPLAVSADKGNLTRVGLTVVMGFSHKNNMEELAGRGEIEERVRLYEPSKWFSTARMLNEKPVGDTNELIQLIKEVSYYPQEGSCCVKFIVETHLF